MVNVNIENFIRKTYFPTVAINTMYVSNGKFLIQTGN